MEQIILVFHFLIAVGLIGLILLQQGKGAEAGASFGSGASQTMFGSSGSWNFFSKMTAVLATVFFATSISLALVAKNRSAVDEALLPELQSIPFESVEDAEVPVLDAPEESLLDEIPQLPVEESSEIPRSE